jgi:hypothetical protein
VRANLAVVSPFADREIDPGQPPLPFRDDLRLETGIPVTRHADLHRARVGEIGDVGDASSFPGVFIGTAAGGSELPESLRLAPRRR